MKIACYTDIHNMQLMLNMPTVLRKSAFIAADNTVKEFGKTDLSVIGGDNVSDYPYPGTDPAPCRMRTGLI